VFDVWTSCHFSCKSILKNTKYLIYKLIYTYLNFPLSFASGRFTDSFIGMAVIEIKGIAVGILFLFHLEVELCLGIFILPLLLATYVWKIGLATRFNMIPREKFSLIICNFWYTLLCLFVCYKVTLKKQFCNLYSWSESFYMYIGKSFSVPLC